MFKKMPGLALLSAVSFSLAAHNTPHATSSSTLTQQHATQSAYQLVFFSDSQKAEYLANYHNAILEVTHNHVVLSLSKAESEALRADGALIIARPDMNRRTQPQRKTSKTMTKPAGGAVTPSQTSGIPAFACYPTLAETQQLAETLAQTYPDFVELKHIGPSWEKSQGLGGHDLTVLVLKNKKKNNWRKRPALYIQGAIHAREYTPGAMTIKFAQYLLEHRDTNADVNWILNEREIHILLIANPDARVLAEQDEMWRKNTNTAYCALDESKRGVDLNRNFDFAWASPVGGSTDDQCAETYHGPSAASEPETQAIQAYLRTVFKDRRGNLPSDPAPSWTQGVFLDLHSYGRYVMWPWSSELTPNPNATELAMLGHRLAAYNDYLAFETKERVQYGGTATNYAYGQYGVAAYTLELGTWFFESCANFEGEIWPNNLNALIYAAKVAKRPYKLPDGPQIIDLRLQGAERTAVPAGTPVNIIAQIADDHFGPALSGQMPRSQAIKKVLLTIRKEGHHRARRVLLSAEDGAFDSAREAINYSLDTRRWRNGRYILTLRAQDESGQWGTRYAKFLTIDNAAPENNRAPVADFSSDCRYAICGFDGTTSQDDQDGLSYRWVFEGARFYRVFHGQQVEIEFGRAGDYQLTLQVEDRHGLRDTKSVSLTLDGVRPPVAQLSYQCNGLSCEFDSSASYDPNGEIVSRYWQFGGDDPAYIPGEAKMTHTFPSPGEYTIILVVVDNEYQSGVISQTIKVSEDE
ncbi:M14 family zinc carboxypeptidase [Pseudoalteromonas rubra]|nr:M14 family zinc carboxypeptidase [Pseudoalteromonas rubra]